MKISCLNPIAAVGMQLFTDAYEKVDDFAASDAKTCKKCKCP